MGEYRPRRTRHLVGERRDHHVRGSALKQRIAPHSFVLGPEQHTSRPMDEQRAQVTVATLADAEQFYRAPSAALLGHEPDIGRKLASRLKGLRISHRRHQCAGR